MSADFSLLRRQRRTLDRLSPGFDQALAEIPFLKREAVEGDAVACFKSEGPVGLLVPRASGGLGASPLEAVHVQTAIGARSPSIAVATTMHQFSVASLVALARAGSGSEALLLSAIAQQRLLLASGFAEGMPGRGILDSGLSVRLGEGMAGADGGVYLSGSKKPCSLATSMDLLTASYVRPTAGGDELMVALVPARSPGLSLHRFWKNRALAGAQSEEVRLDDVHVPARMLFSAGLKQALGEVQIIGFVWFELLMSASYLGACSGFVEQVVQRQRWAESDRVELACSLQLCMSALEGVAAEFAVDGSSIEGSSIDDLLPRLLLLRYELERQVSRISDLAHAMSGGMSFIQSEESSLWMLSCKGLQFHPPARISMVSSLATYLRDGNFSMSPSTAVQPEEPT